MLSGLFALGDAQADTDAGPISISAGLLDPVQADTLGLAEVPGTETIAVFRPTDGENTFNHGAVVAGFDGRLFVQWQTSERDEDSADTHVVYSSSVDGRQWTEPKQLAPSPPGTMTTSGGWWQYDGQLIAFINVWPHAGDIRRGGYTMVTRTSDGTTWSDLEPVYGADGGPVRGIFEQDPGILPGGRVISAFHMQPGLQVAPFYTDDPLATRGWRRGLMENLESTGPVSREIEPSWFRRRDGSLVMVFRDQQETFRKLASVSDDRGETWSQPVLTNIPDARTKQSAGNLPDGSAYLVGNPVDSRSRFPLVVLLSADGHLFDRARLAPDGLSVAGEVEHVYDPWRYPDDWVVETFAPEGPKIVRRGDWFYMITAVGGTAGPPTGHMVIVARSRSVDGPWQNYDDNPVVRTESAEEKWWSRGHATLFEGPGGQWWMIYHGYENGYWTLGRQALLEPVTWTEDGWPRPLGGDLSQPIPKPVDLGIQPHGQRLSDDFSADRFGTQWAFYDPQPGEEGRVRRSDGILHLQAKGTTPGDSSPVSCIVGDHSYSVAVDVDIDAGVEAGLLLFYNRRLYAGLGIGPDGLMMHRYGLQRLRGAIPGQRESAQASKRIDRMRIRLTNGRNILTIHTSLDGGASWTKFDVQMEVSGYHHNVAYDFLSLRPALYAAGQGEARFSHFEYRGLMAGRQNA